MIQADLMKTAKIEMVMTVNDSDGLTERKDGSISHNLIRKSVLYRELWKPNLVHINEFHH